MVNNQDPNLPSDFTGYNTSGSSIPAFSAVRITGAATHPEDTGSFPTIDLAQANLSDDMPCAGITTADIENGATGTVRAFGVITDLDTSAFAGGDLLYVDGSVAGLVVNSNNPPADITQRVGAVLVSDATVGQVFVYIDPMMDGHVRYTNRDEFEISSPTTANTRLTMSSTGGATALLSSPTGTRDLTLPDATDTLVGKATTDTLTGKTFDTAGAGNSLLINGLAATANTGTGAVVRGNGPSITAPLVSGGLFIVSSVSNQLRIRSTEALTAERILGLVVNDASRTLTIAGDATISGTNTGDQTNISGNAATVTTNANLTGPVTSVGNATTITPGTAAYTLKSSSAASPAAAWTAAGILFRREWQYLADPGAATGTRVGLLTAPTLSGTVSNQDSNTRPLVRHVTATAAPGDSAGVLSGFDVCRSGWLPKIAFVFQTGASATSGRWWCGMTTATLVGVATPTTQHVAAFSYDTARDGTVFWRTVTNDGVGAATVTASSVAFATSTTYNLRIELNGATNVLFWIDDVLVATHTTTLPSVANLLGFQMSATNLTSGGGTAKRFEWSRVGGEGI